MNTAVMEYVDPTCAPAVRTRERKKDIWGMGLFIGTEAMLFAMFFFAYLYLAATDAEWPPHEAPALKLPLVLLVILLFSSATAFWAQRGIEADRPHQLQLGLLLTLLLGVAFFSVQFIEYRQHLHTLTPQEGAYGSVFYTITSFHLAHVILGFLMLVYLLARAVAGHFSAERHLAVKNVVLYWHFVDAVWVIVVLLLYLSPQFYGGVP